MDSFSQRLEGWNARGVVGYAGSICFCDPASLRRIEVHLSKGCQQNHDFFAGPSVKRMSRGVLQRYYWEAAKQRRAQPGDDFRSEEHTSELQSQSNIVCRLLLEKQ